MSYYRLWSSRLHCRNLCCQRQTCLSFISEFNPGGQLTTTNEVENFPGYVDGVTGTEMMVQLQTQTKRFGTDVRDGWATKVRFSGDIHKVWINGSKEIHCKKYNYFNQATANI
jgi:thioredoxin reductase (NADPH)